MLLCNSIFVVILLFRPGIPLFFFFFFSHSKNHTVRNSRHWSNTWSLDIIPFFQLKFITAYRVEYCSHCTQVQLVKAGILDIRSCACTSIQKKSASSLRSKIKFLCTFVNEFNLFNYVQHCKIRRVSSSSSFFFARMSSDIL